VLDFLREQVEPPLRFTIRSKIHVCFPFTQAASHPGLTPDHTRPTGAEPPTLKVMTALSSSVRDPLEPGSVSPMRDVPRHIPRPEYVGKPAPSGVRESDVKDAETIERMRIAGRIAAQALVEVGRHIVPGTTTDELDRIGHEFLLDHDAYPSTLGYRGYPKSLCSSLNEVICHGIPDSTVLVDGDICNIDITAFIGGVHGDTNATFYVGEVREEVRLLVERTREATMRAISAVAPGRPLNVVGRVIESYAKRFNYGVVRDFTGHGIGTSFHSGLIVPHYDDPSLDVVMERGMTFTIEPMLTLGTYDYDMWNDGWTVVTKDRSWTAQFEHTILVTESGSEILTTP
jgi:methionyl aminopeptidase